MENLNREICAEQTKKSRDTTISALFRWRFICFFGEKADVALKRGEKWANEGIHRSPRFLTNKGKALLSDHFL